MPQKSTLSRGAITSRRRLPRAACRSAGLGRPDEIAAGLLVGVELDQPFLLGFLEKIGECLEAIVGLVEAGLAPLESLLDHRAPDALARAALANQRVERLQHQVEGFLFLVLARRRRLAAFLGRAPLLLVLAHQ